MDFSYPGTSTYYISGGATSTYYTSTGHSYSTGSYPITASTITINPQLGFDDNIHWSNPTFENREWGISGFSIKPEWLNDTIHSLQPPDVLPDELEKLFIIPVLMKGE